MCSSPFYVETTNQLGLAGSAIFLGQALSGRPDAVLAKEVKEELPMVGKITKNGVKYFEYRVGDGESPRHDDDQLSRSL